MMLLNMFIDTIFCDRLVDALDISATWLFLLRCGKMVSHHELIKCFSETYVEFVFDEIPKGSTTHKKCVYASWCV